MQDYSSWTLKEKLIFILGKLGRAHTPAQILDTMNTFEPVHRITTSAILLCSRAHPDYLDRYQDDIEGYIVVGLKDWFTDSGVINPDFQHIHATRTRKSRAAKYGFLTINKKQFLPMSSCEHDLGAITFTKDTLSLQTTYNTTWITSNKILYLLSQSPSLSADQIIEAIIEFEPYQKRRVKIVRKNVEICIKRLLRDQKIAQLTTDTYYLTIY